MTDSLPSAFSPGDVLTAAEMNLILTALSDTMNSPLISGSEQKANKGVNNGYAALGSDGCVPWNQLKPNSQKLPFAFVFSGKPPSGGMFNVILALPINLPANLTGSLTYCNTLPTANMVFTINKISNNVKTAIATVTLTSNSHTSGTFSSQAQVSFATSDIIQVVAPATIDATAADICITLLAQRPD